MNIVTEKKCKKCGEVKDVLKFPKEQRNLCGYAGTCKECEEARKRAAYFANKQMCNARSKEWSVNNKEKVVNYRKDYREKNSDKLIQESAKWREDNKEAVKESSRKYRDKNKNKIAAAFLLWMNANKEKYIEAKKTWAKNNQDKILEYSRNRRALVKGSAGKITNSEWLDVCNKYGNKCLCCGKADTKLTLDHVIPLSKGGGNSIENVQPLCFSCNSKKGTKHIDYR